MVVVGVVTGASSMSSLHVSYFCVIICNSSLYVFLVQNFDVLQWLLFMCLCCNALERFAVAL